MSKIGEFELIGRISASVTVPQGVTGIGDDCAIIPQKQGLDTLVTTDLLIEGRHFLLDDVTPYRLGWKSAAVNISDIAAMGGRPTSAFLSIAMPKGLSDKRIAMLDGDPDQPVGPCQPVGTGQPGGSGHPVGFSHHGGEELWIDGFIRGFNACCSRFGVSLLGGDTSASPSQLFINVTVMGDCPHGSAVRRDGALPGDLICVTGPLGDSGTGLKLILERISGAGGSGDGGRNGRCGDIGSIGSNGSTVDSSSIERSGGTRGTVDFGDGVSNGDREDTGSAGSNGSTGDGSTGRSGVAEISPEEYLIGRHYLPEPRVDIGQTLAATPGVHSMMDISDGIASDLRHILEASSRRFQRVQEAPCADSASLQEPLQPHQTVQQSLQTSLRSSQPGASLGAEIDLQSLQSSQPGPSLGAEIDLRSLPISAQMRAVCAARGWDAAEIAVSGGEDYELLFTAAPGTSLPDGCTVIGRIVQGGGGIRWIGSDKEFKGFTHF